MNERSGSTVDLHCHSTASDGTLTPTAVVDAAADAGVQILALTDHDSVAGLDEAARTAAARGIRLVPGVELSVSWQQRTLHVVGLGINPAAPALGAGLAVLQQRRADRAAAIAARMERLGVPDALTRAEALAGGGQITRTHFAQLFVAAGLSKDIPRAFHRYLARGRQAYASARWADLEDAIGWIHAAGGQAVLAHPMKYSKSRKTRQEMLAAFRAAGGDAMEICCGTSDAREIAAGVCDALAHDLAGSVGSDFHGAHQPWIRFGRLPALPDSVRPVAALA